MEPSAETAYVFRHAVLRDAAYQLQLPGARQALHALAFDLIEAALGGQAPQAPPLDAQADDSPTPHPTDSVAAELADQARLAMAGGRNRKLQPRLLLYLRRGAEFAEKHYANAPAISMWRELAEHLDPAGAGEALRRASVIARQSGRNGLALTLLEDALPRLEQHGSPFTLGMAKVNLANVLRETGNPKAAEAHLSEGMALAKRHELPYLKAVAATNQAVLCRTTGRLAEAEALYDQALEMNRALGRREQESAVLTNVAVVYQESGRTEKAEQACLDAIAAGESANNRRAVATAMGNLANIYSQTGRLQQALEANAEATKRAREMGDRRAECYALESLAVFEHTLGKIGACEARHQQALELARELGDRRLAGIILSNLASVMLDRGATDQALQAIESCIADAQALGDGRALGVAHGQLGQLYRRLGDLLRSDEEYRRALGFSRQVNDRRGEALSLCDHALCLLELQRGDEAAAQWREGIAMLRGLRDQLQVKSKIAAMRLACDAPALPASKQTPESRPQTAAARACC